MMNNKAIGVILIIIGVAFIVAPIIAWYISLDNISNQEISEENERYLKEIGKRTWGFFESYITEENNFSAIVVDKFVKEINNSDKYIEKVENMTLPALPMRGLVIFPGVPTSFEINNKRSVAAMKAAVALLNRIRCRIRVLSAMQRRIMKSVPVHVLKSSARIVSLLPA